MYFIFALSFLFGIFRVFFCLISQEKSTHNNSECKTKLMQTFCLYCSRIFLCLYLFCMNIILILPHLFIISFTTSLGYAWHWCINITHFIWVAWLVSCPVVNVYNNDFNDENVIRSSDSGTGNAFQMLITIRAHAFICFSL